MAGVKVKPPISHQTRVQMKHKTISNQPTFKEITMARGILITTKRQRIMLMLKTPKKRSRLSNRSERFRRVKAPLKTPGPRRKVRISLSREPSYSNQSEAVMSIRMSLKSIKRRIVKMARVKESRSNSTRMKSSLTNPRKLAPELRMPNPSRR